MFLLQTYLLKKIWFMYIAYPEKKNFDRPMQNLDNV